MDLQVKNDQKNPFSSKIKLIDKEAVAAAQWLNEFERNSRSGEFPASGYIEIDATKIAALNRRLGKKLKNGDVFGLPSYWGSDGNAMAFESSGGNSKIWFGMGKATQYLGHSDVRYFDSYKPWVNKPKLTTELSDPFFRFGDLEKRLLLVFFVSVFGPMLPFILLGLFS